MAYKTISAKDDAGSETEPTSGLRELKGTRTYSPGEQIIREQILDVMRKWFKIYGYMPLETPILELYDIAASKYGGGAEILKETFRLSDQGGRDLCLRYELTFKFAKFIGMNPMIRMPIKRYEIGKVFRDGPVKLGRLREFTQCDVDQVGMGDVYADAELIDLTFHLFNDLNIDIRVEINDRKILFGIFEQAGIPKDLAIDAALSIDKLAKMGEAKVKAEMLDKGISAESIDKVLNTLKVSSEAKSNTDRLERLAEIIKDGQGKEGIDELKHIFGYLDTMGTKGSIEFSPSLARGLGYYTGPMWEVYLKDSSKISASVAAGGRWDKMIGQFLGTEKANYPATGMTFGLDVIYTAMTTMSGALKAEARSRVPSVLVIPIDGAPGENHIFNYSLHLTSLLRTNLVSSEISEKKLVRSMERANKDDIPYVIIVGPSELSEGKVKLRDMKSGKEEVLDAETAVRRLREFTVGTPEKA
ncbi:MAG: histidine--tRNA ligase [Candidatus Marsarchaeota archaeon]|jgi:histidyl-tRNA synthetase|nr:histidine--tRNA ligase [Candidatus Marsarchaeota archaeon]MCL5418597.1 histidine--tRNA ligase [Candidatus Marsarchaeota archaeon]